MSVLFDGGQSARIASLRVMFIEQDQRTGFCRAKKALVCVSFRERDNCLSFCLVASIIGLEC
jgi:hypothetical protein